MNFAIGKKLNMSQVLEQETGTVIPVSVVKVAPMTVTQIKTAEGKDKYGAIQVGVGKRKKIGKTLKGHLKNLGNFATLSEFRVLDSNNYQTGQKLDLTGFQVGEVVNVVGTTKGKGFQGAMKRHGFKGFPASHGHDKPRSVGSIGQRWPQHVRKGLRMAGHMGNLQATIKNLQVVEVDAKRNLIALKGALPGAMNSVVKIISTGKVKPLVVIKQEKEEKKKK